MITSNKVIVALILALVALFIAALTSTDWFPNTIDPLGAAFIVILGFFTLHVILTASLIIATVASRRSLRDNAQARTASNLIVAGSGAVVSAIAVAYALFFVFA